ncbi:hypothetical protein F4553_004885 [Allocatelliglobosispora scoriae]|uniref:Uncharacterized protein n=1 Tax=Allocatelliglobosispora scoriae TaxID=643052 RepID=A0A841BVK6_9ACTN|nr:hypothetical protein [Allocatelliglobosispora scoriae]
MIALLPGNKPYRGTVKGLLPGNSAIMGPASTYSTPTPPHPTQRWAGTGRA